MRGHDGGGGRAGGGNPGMREGSWLLHVVMSQGVAAQKVHVKEDLGKAPRL